MNQVNESTVFQSLKSTRKAPPQGYFRFGFSSILLCFVILCIATFGALSLTTANSDKKLSQKVADSTTAYFEAESRMYERLAEIDEELSSGTSSLSGTVTLEEAIDESRTLVVEIEITDLRNAEVSSYASKPHYYEITSWKTVTVMTEEPDMTLHLLLD